MTDFVGSDGSPGTIGRYQVIGRIGGTQADIYSAIDVDMGRRVAIKILHARAAALPTAPLVHLNIVTVFDVDEQEGKPYLVMELLDGAPILDFLEQGAARSLNQKIDLLLQICDGLQAAHDRGIAHGHLTPREVFVQRDGSVKILGFELGGAGDVPSDILAAVTLFDLILAGDATQDLRDVLMKAHHRKAASRYQSMAALRAAIDQVRHVTNSGQYRTLAAAFDRYQKIEALIDERRALGRQLKVADIEAICDAEAARLALRFPEFARSTKADLLPVTEQDETAALAELQIWHNEQLASVAVLRTASGQK